MKVNDTKEIKPLREVGGKETVARTAARREAAAGEERVSVSDGAAEFRVAVEEAKRSAGQSRTARLEALKTAIKQGHYRPDAQRIADQILEEAELNASLRALLMK
jgi:flagellar biosynthesis anti-sigma factor FlgM